jgi:hypothetical protein
MAIKEILAGNSKLISDSITSLEAVLIYERFQPPQDKVR